MKKDQKVVQFPNLRKRILERGYEALRQSHFELAYTCFSQLSEMGISTKETDLALVVCLMELGKNEEALEKCKIIIYEEKPILLDAVEVYVSLLINAHRYEEITETLTWLSKQGVDEERLQQLKEAMAFTEKKPSFLQEPVVPKDELYQTLFESKNVMKQLAMVHGLKTTNIRLQLPTLKAYLAQPEGNPVVKSTILFLLMEQGVSEGLKIEKFGNEREVVPAYLSDPLQEEKVKEVFEKLEREVGDHNPTLYEHLKETYIQYLYTVFPFLDEYEVVEYLAALIYFGDSLFGEEERLEEILEMFSLPDSVNVLFLYNQFISLEKYGQIDV